MPGKPPAVYLHVGPPKTGTTFLQDVLWLNQTRLADQGVTVPDRQVAHFHAALDLRGIAFGGFEHPAVSGAWRRLAARALEATGRVVISHEVLAGAQPDQIQTAVASLAPAEAHVVYAARDLGRQLPAVWQEGLKNRQTNPYGRFLKRALKPGAAETERGFWRSQDAVAVLARWAQHVPAERITVVTLPPTDTDGGSGRVLWDRFCAALDIDGSDLDLDVARSNKSLSAAQCEVLRLLNRSLPEDLEWPAYERLVKSRFNDAANAGSPGRRAKIPGRHRDNVLACAEQQISGLKAGGYRVIGDLDDLRPSDSAFGRARAKPAQVTRAAVLLLATALDVPDRPDSVGQRARTLMGRIQGRGKGPA